MKTESWIWKSVKKGARVTALLCVLVAGRAAVNYQGTLRVADALVGGKRIDCTAGAVARDPNYPNDVIAVFGAGVDHYDGGPSDAGKMRLQGAAEAYLKRLAPRIALVGDADGDGDGGSLGKSYLVNRYAIPEEAILVGRDGSINTATDAARLVEMAQKFGWRRALLPESDSHGNRATQFTCDGGLATSWFTAHNNGPADLKESLELAVTSFDPDGWIPIAAKWLSLVFTGR